MDPFLKYNNELSKRINAVANDFFNQLQRLDIQSIGLDERVYQYFQFSHFKRQFFSVQTAAEMLYRSLTKLNKPIEDIVLMDYGAGVGSLYLMAKLLGCKQVIHGDIMVDMHEAGQKVALAMGIEIDHYILGDHNVILSELKDKGIQCDLILSRNVIEHIYDLKDFYTKMMAFQPQALHYNSTTANFKNPAMLWHHKNIHRKFESDYLNKRKEIISSQIQDLSEDDLQKLSVATRGLAVEDLTLAIDNYKKNKVLPDPGIHYTNTCDPENGVWAEHIIPPSEYYQMLTPLGYEVEILPAFWDTHYSSPIKNVIGKTMNFITEKCSSEVGLRVTAFIYVVLYKK